MVGLFFLPKILDNELNFFFFIFFFSLGGIVSMIASSSFDLDSGSFGCMRYSLLPLSADVTSMGERKKTDDNQNLTNDLYIISRMDMMF